MSDRWWAPRKSAFAHLDLARRANQLSRENLVYPPRKKYFAFAVGQISATSSRHPTPTRGAFRDRHERGEGCGGRGSVGRDCDRRAVFRERSCSARTNGASTPPPKLRPAARGRLRDWWRLLRTAKPCGPGTRCWCQAGGGFSNPTGFRSAVNSPATVTRRIRRRGERGISR
jgi:hypothetical protein